MPFAQAQQRLVARCASEARDEGTVHECKNAFEYCPYASAFLSGPRRGPNENSVRNAVFTRGYRQGICCPRLCAAATGEAIESVILKTRYAWGRAAVFGLALRFLSVQAIRHATLRGACGAYALRAMDGFPRANFPNAPPSLALKPAGADALRALTASSPVGLPSVAAIMQRLATRGPF